MATTKQSASIQDLEMLPDSECCYDLIRGELFGIAPAGGARGEIAAEIIGSLWTHVKTNGIGRVYTSETGFILARNPDVVLGPDAAFIQRERVPERQHGFYEIAPDLTVEVVSPNDSASYVRSKVREYLRAGVRQVWIVDPGLQTVTVYDNADGVRFLGIEDELDGGDVLPGFSVPVAEIFE